VLSPWSVPHTTFSIPVSGKKSRTAPGCDDGKGGEDESRNTAGR
jgi:hypothetical protein